MYLFIYSKLYDINNIFLKRKFNYCRCCLQRRRCFVWIFVCAHHWGLILCHILYIVTAALSNYSYTTIHISPGLPAAWSRSSHPPATCYPWVILGSVSDGPCEISSSRNISKSNVCRALFLVSFSSLCHALLEGC